jgi:sigma-B regulation protein RsbU (phosphoserine phosphatase)
MFVTVFYGILNTLKGEIEYVNAGHNPPYLLSASGITKVEPTNGIALGVMEKINFLSKKIEIKPGEKLYLYTDGITEAFDQEEKAYGTEKLENFLLQHLDAPIIDIVQDTFSEVDAFVDGAPQSDDITLLAISYNGLDS